MSIFRRVSFLGLALVSLVVLAACGGNGGDGDGEAFELPPPGEYSFEVTGTIEVLFPEDAVSAAPLAIGVPQVGNVSGGLTIQFGEGGKFTIKDREGVDLVAGKEAEGAEGGALPITFTQNEEKESTGTISGDGVVIELNVEAWQTGSDGPVTSRNEQPIRLEGEGDPFSDEGATLSTPPDAETVNFFVSAGEVDPMLLFGIPTLFIGLFGGFGFELVSPDPDEDLPTDTEAPDESVLEFSDAKDDATDCATGEPVVDPAVDIEGVNVRKVGENIEVEIRPVQSPTKSFKDYSNAIILFLFGWEGLAEFHAGLMRQGQTDSNGNIIPGTEDAVTVTDDAVTFTVTDGGSIPEGSLLEVRAFHTEAEGGTKNCDTFMDELSLSELQSLPCGGECTRDE